VLTMILHLLLTLQIGRDYGGNGGVFRLSQYALNLCQLNSQHVGSFTDGGSPSVRPRSVVSIATAYRLDGPGIESWCGRDFPHPSRPALRPTQPPVQWVPGLSRG
jgi:hypothetical protein